MTTIDLVLLATEAHEEQGEFTDINFATALWVWIAFIVTFLILRKVAWPIFQRKMEERENTIAEGLRLGEEAEERARNLMAQRERAKKEIGLERAKAVEELKRATVELTLEASARLLKREISDEDHRRLAREVVDEVASGRWMVEESVSP
jgi:F0F1-type ATP synthase membrane subunit b/b'